LLLLLFFLRFQADCLGYLAVHLTDRSKSGKLPLISKKPLFLFDYNELVLKKIIELLDIGLIILEDIGLTY
jgi:hypothetical protein